MSISMKRFVLNLFVAVGLPVMILAGVFLSILIVMFPISCFMGWV